jgi:hypothetical protein
MLPISDLTINAMNKLEAISSSLLSMSVIEFLGCVTAEDISSTTVSAYDNPSHLPIYDADPLSSPLPYDPALFNDLAPTEPISIEPQSLGVLSQAQA